jgi:hypothetical protein
MKGILPTLEKSLYDGDFKNQSFLDPYGFVKPNYKYDEKQKRVSMYYNISDYI